MTAPARDGAGAGPGGRRRPRILVLSEVAPFHQNNGQRVRLHHLLCALASVGDVVFTLLYRTEEQRAGAGAYAFGGRVRLVRLSEVGSGAGLYARVLAGRLHLPRRTAEEVSRVVREEAPDVGWLDYGYLGHLIPVFHRAGVPVAYGAHNAEAALATALWCAEPSLARRLKSAPLVAAAWLHERRFFPAADTFVCISEQDRERYRSWLDPDRVEVLPNFRCGAGLERVPAFAAPHPYAACVGGLDALQNLEGALHLLRAIWPSVAAAHPEVRLYLVGRLPPEGSERRSALDAALLAAPRVVTTGEVEDTLPFVKGAAMTLAPLLSGGGTRTKIVESAACGTPVVSTAKGAEGLPFEDGRSILLADEPGAFAAAMLRLLEDTRARTAIGAAARQAFDRELGTEANALRLQRIVEVTRARARGQVVR